MKRFRGSKSPSSNSTCSGSSIEFHAVSPTWISSPRGGGGSAGPRSPDLLGCLRSNGRSPGPGLSGWGVSFQVRSGCDRRSWRNWDLKGFPPTGNQFQDPSSCSYAYTATSERAGLPPQIPICHRWVYLVNHVCTPNSAASQGTSGRPRLRIANHRAPRSASPSCSVHVCNTPGCTAAAPGTASPDR